MAGRDLFLSYNHAEAGVVTRLNDLLASRGVSTFIDRKNLTPGISWYNEIEDALAEAKAVVVFLGQSGLGRTQKRELDLALVLQTRQAFFPVIPVFIQGFEGSEPPGFLISNTAVDLRQNESEGLDALARVVAGRLPDPPPAAAVCPYRGLGIFREEDHPFFFGRERYVARLTETVDSRRFAAVVGASGSGKSSLVAAGLLPELRTRRPDRGVWESVSFVPGKHPYDSFASALVALMYGDIDPIERGEKIVRQANLMRSSGRLITDIVFGSVGVDRLLIVVDQFEELFTLVTDDAERSEFLSLLLGALDGDQRLALIITLRADFFEHATSASRALNDLVNSGIVSIGPMTTEELRSAIEAPARRQGVGFEPGVVDLMLEHVESEPGGLPLLQFALQQMWQGLEMGRLTAGAYERLGQSAQHGHPARPGLLGAVGRQADDVWASLNARERALALKVFSRLVRVSAVAGDGPDTRQRVRWSQLTEGERTVAAPFVEKRLLVKSNDIEGLSTGGEQTLEVAHEALLRHWDRLREHLDEQERKFLSWRQRLGQRLEEWRSTGDRSALLSGKLLREARDWAKRRRPDLNRDEQRYITASIRARRRTRLFTVAMLGLSSGAVIYVATAGPPGIDSVIERVKPDLAEAASDDAVTTVALALDAKGGGAKAQQFVMAAYGKLRRAPRLALAQHWVAAGHQWQARNLLMETATEASAPRFTEQIASAEDMKQVGMRDSALELARAAVDALEVTGFVYDQDMLSLPLAVKLAVELGAFDVASAAASKAKQVYAKETLQLGKRARAFAQLALALGQAERLVPEGRDALGRAIEAFKDPSYDAVDIGLELLDAAIRLSDPRSGDIATALAKLAGERDTMANATLAGRLLELSKPREALAILKSAVFARSYSAGKLARRAVAVGGVPMADLVVAARGELERDTGRRVESETLNAVARELTIAGHYHHALVFLEDVSARSLRMLASLPRARRASHSDSYYPRRDLGSAVRIMLQFPDALAARVGLFAQRLKAGLSNLRDPSLSDDLACDMAALLAPFGERVTLPQYRPCEYSDIGARAAGRRPLLPIEPEYRAEGWQLLEPAVSFFVGGRSEVTNPQRLMAYLEGLERAERRRGAPELVRALALAGDVTSATTFVEDEVEPHSYCDMGSISSYLVYSEVAPTPNGWNHATLSSCSHQRESSSRSSTRDRTMRDLRMALELGDAGLVTAARAFVEEGMVTANDWQGMNQSDTERAVAIFTVILTWLGDEKQGAAVLANAEHPERMGLDDLNTSFEPWLHRPDRIPRARAHPQDVDRSRSVLRVLCDGDLYVVPCLRLAELEISASDHAAARNILQTLFDRGRRNDMPRELWSRVLRTKAQFHAGVGELKEADRLAGLSSDQSDKLIAYAAVIRALPTAASPRLQPPVWLSQLASGDASKSLRAICEDLEP